ncbi:hypothetical protein [Pseudomonas rhizoryzae]|uniref:hypothetical protein n=1 Tax=Pseudomonas rhizoryzae TaxID=2571129 RepID=UPI0010C1EF2E|nr:hypothetical protein [Pseudomonas rhizoryzae]
MIQPYAAWLRDRFQACTCPFVLHSELIPHARSLAASCRQEMAAAESASDRAIYQRMAEDIEKLVDQYAAAE